MSTTPVTPTTSRGRNRYDEWTAYGTEPEQYVSATAGGATAESGSDQPGRSFAVRRTTGAVQRTERSDVDLSVAAASCSGDRRDGVERRDFARRERSTSAGANPAVLAATGPALAGVSATAALPAALSAERAFSRGGTVT